MYMSILRIDVYCDTKQYI